MDGYITKEGKTLRLGYTTGSCAAGAATAAAAMLLTGQRQEHVRLVTPRGIVLELDVEEIAMGPDAVSCAIRKDPGDDPDVTRGAQIFAAVSRTSTPGIAIHGGTGVGRVTRPGLDQPVGQAAINSTPRRMIREGLEQICRQTGWSGGLTVTIWVPQGEELAQKTFNPLLGIQGGISILGTSGIVEPMSEEALVKTIQLELRQRVAQGGAYLLAVPGNYGADYIRAHTDLPTEQIVKCSNYIGQTIDLALDAGAKGLLFVSHIGKAIKLAAGIMNTHSRWGDGRLEILAANAIRAGLSRQGALEVLDAATTEEGLMAVAREGLLAPLMDQLAHQIGQHLERRAGDRLLVGAVLFSNRLGHLGQTGGAQRLIELLKSQHIDTGGAR